MRASNKLEHSPRTMTQQPKSLFNILVLALILALAGSYVILRGHSWWGSPANLTSQLDQHSPATMAALGSTTSRANLPAPDAPTRTRVSDSFGKLPLYFVENRGQMDEHVAYYLQGHDKTVYFTAAGLTFALAAPAEARRETTTTPNDKLYPAAFRNESASEASPARWTLKLDFVGPNPEVRPVGRDQTEAVFSYFTGPREQWHAGLKSYASIVYPEIWPGIDLIYTGTVNRMKYRFIVKPGADPGQIKLAYRGASRVKINRAGELEVHTPVGGFSDEQPVSYQEVAGQEVAVTTSYRLEAGAESSKAIYGFQVGDYDRSRELVIDPAVLVYCGYIGGSGSDEGDGIVVDSAGNAYVTGGTRSDQTSFPVAAGPDLTFNGGGGDDDVFVAKVNPAGTALIYCGYIGGSDDEVGRGIAVDSIGNAYVTGFTRSTQTSFPVMIGPDLTFNGTAFFDTFVAKVNVTGTGLIYCGYIGGSGGEVGRSIAVDSTGNAHITGETDSDQTTFPVTVGPDLTFNGATFDAFVAKVNAAGTALVYCGYIGGSGNEDSIDIAVDSAGNAYVAGYTDSTEASFPVAVGPGLTYNGGTPGDNRDAFVAKVSAAGTALVYCGYIGGDGRDVGLGIAVDSAGNAYVTGSTTSSQTSFPVTVGPDLTYNGGGDVYVAKVNPAGTSLVYCGYIGGSGNDVGFDVAVDSVGNAYVVGNTLTTDTSFPVTGGPDLTYNGGLSDAFVAKVNAAGTALVYCGYIGGSDTEDGHHIAVDRAGNAYVIGTTGSSQATFPVTVGPDLIFNGGGSDAFVAKIAGVEPIINCNTICFRSSQFFLLNLAPLPPGVGVIIGGMNFNVPTRNLTAIRLALQGGANPLQQLNQQFVAAQLSLIRAVGHSSPAAFSALNSSLRCYGLIFAPVILNNGVTLTVNSSLADLFNQVRLAISENRTNDMLKLAGLLELLNGDDPLGSCGPHTVIPGPPASMPIGRLQITFKTCDMPDAGTDNTVQVKLNANNSTRIDYGRDDFRRNDEFTYDLLLEGVNTASDIQYIQVSKSGSDGWCIQSLSLVVNGKPLFTRSFGTGLWLDNCCGFSNSFLISKIELEDSLEWMNFTVPCIPTKILGGDIESLIEGMVGEFIHDNRLYWGHLHGRAVEATKKDDKTINIDLDLAYDLPFLPDPEVDVDLDIVVECDSGDISLTPTNVRLDVDFGVFDEILIVLNPFVGITFKLLINLALRFIEVSLQSQSVSIGLCPTITITDDGGIAFSFPFPIPNLCP